MEYVWFAFNVLVRLGLWITHRFIEKQSIQYHQYGKIQICCLQIDMQIMFQFSLQDWSTEGYQLFMIRQLNEIIPSENSSINLDKYTSFSSLASVNGPSASLSSSSNTSSKDISESVHKPSAKRCNSSLNRTILIQLDFVKSILTINPCMVSAVEVYSRIDRIVLKCLRLVEL